MAYQKFLVSVNTIPIILFLIFSIILILSISSIIILLSACGAITSRVFLVFHPMLCWYVGTMYEDIFNNDFNAIVSQINFVQQREPSSMFLGILNCLLVLLLCLLMSLSTTFSFTP